MKLNLKLALVAVCCLNLPVYAEDQATSLHSLNATFRRIYAQARQEYKDKTSPVIVALAGKLTLFRDGKRDEHSIIPPQWETLKMVDHIPLALFVLLRTRTDHPLDASTLDSLRSIRDGIVASETQIGGAELSAETLARQRSMLSDTRQFIDRITQQGAVSSAQLSAFVSSVSKRSLDNAYDAEVYELSTVDKLVHGWKQQMSPAEWKNLHVVICSGHMPRRQEHLTQYFSALLGQKEEGDRIVVMENGDDEQKALDLLATHELDEQIARSYFKDRWRMHRDLLADGAKRYLKEHPPSR